MKQELEAEYLATFKKTVAMHETFLCRLVSHPVFRNDMNLAIFLEYDKELNVRGKNKKEKLLDVLTSVQKSGDELLLSNTLKDVDEFFDNERKFLLEYFTNLRDATHKADKMVVLHKSLAENYIKISTGLVDLSAMDETNRGNEQVSPLKGASALDLSHFYFYQGFFSNVTAVTEQVLNIVIMNYEGSSFSFDIEFSREKVSCQ